MFLQLLLLLVTAVTVGWFLPDFCERKLGCSPFVATFILVVASGVIGLGFAMAWEFVR
jgi:hypothetical protein